MASIDTEILESAYKDGAFKNSPNEYQANYFRSSVITAWEVINVIAESKERGIERAAIAKKMRMNPNTVGYFVRWLLDKKIIQAESPKGDEIIPMYNVVYRIAGM
jgi:hypothetical protein